MTEPVLVTGATGTVGQHAVTALADRDVHIKLRVRDPDTVPEELAAGGPAVKIDFTKPEKWVQALHSTYDGAPISTVVSL